jgi:hypothetical protein
MIKKISLIIAILASFYIEYALIKGEILFDILGVVVLILSIGFKVLASIYTYKELSGWDTFENPEGFSLKKKKK